MGGPILEQVPSKQDSDPSLSHILEDLYYPSSDFDIHSDEEPEQQVAPLVVNTPTEEGVGCYDVLCGRHKAAFNNVGNRRFRVTVSLSLNRYLQAKSRKDRSVVIASVTALVHSIGGRFLQRKNGAWVELSEKEAHNKTGHALRDMAAAVARHPGRAVVPNAATSSSSKVAVASATKSTRAKVDDDSLLPSQPHTTQLQEATVPTVASPISHPHSLEDMIPDMSPQELCDLHQSFAEESCPDTDEADRMLAWLAVESSKVVMHEV